MAMPKTTENIGIGMAVHVKERQGILWGLAGTDLEHNC